MIQIVEDIIQETYAFYNKSAKRQRRLKELASPNARPTIEDTMITDFEKVIEKTLEQGTISYYCIYY